MKRPSTVTTEWAEFIYCPFSISIAFRVRVKNWLNAGEASKSHSESLLMALVITSCPKIHFSSLRSLVTALRNSANHPTSMTQTVDESTLTYQHWHVQYVHQIVD